ncbi:MAG: nuclear transport factor 2 family protein [Pseudomonadota bacterium]
MRELHMLLIIAVVSVFLSGRALAEPEISDAQLRNRADELSASTLVGGEGWEVYEKILHPDYSRWAMGEVYEGREKFVKSLEEWWNYGMRVASRDIDMVGVDMADDLAIIRFKTTESFVGPDGEAPGFSGYVTNIWIRNNGDWKLLSAEISSTAAP